MKASSQQLLEKATRAIEAAVSLLENGYPEFIQGMKA